jgi:biotin carboxylase
MPGKKVLLFVGAGPEMVPGIRWARELGLSVVATDQHPSAPGFSIADYAEVASTRDVEATLEVAHQYASSTGLHGVMTLACDVPLTVSTVADSLGLPGLSASVARIAQNKILMKEKLAEEGIPIPRFRAVSSRSDAIKAAVELGFPLVIKPADNSAARGVSLVTNQEELLESLRWAKLFRMHEKSLLMEEFLPGPQISTESIVCNGDIVTTGFADRNYQRLQHFAPHFIEDGHTIPSNLSRGDQRSVRELAERTIRALGIDFGVGKGDLVLTARGPKVIEFAARLSGGRFSTDTVPLSSGVNIVKALIRLSVGESVAVEDLQPKYHRAAAQRYLFPPPGRVIAIEGVAEVEEQELVTRTELYVGPGDLVKRVTNHSERSGYVIAGGASRGEAVRTAEWARDRIRIHTRHDQAGS